MSLGGGTEIFAVSGDYDFPSNVLPGICSLIETRAYFKEDASFHDKVCSFHSERNRDHAETGAVLFVDPPEPFPGVFASDSRVFAECFADAAEEVVAEGRKLLKERAGKTPDARQQKILSYAKGSGSFSMDDVVGWMPDVPRRTLERDIAALVKKRALKAKGELKARVYQLVKK